MIPSGRNRVATLRGAPDQLAVGSTARFILLLGGFLLGNLLVAPHVAVNGVAPDFYVMAVVFGALRWGPLWGAVLGFVLGINRDAILLDDFGMYGLALTVVGFAVGKMKQALYLDLPALDMALLCAAGVVTGLVAAVVGAHESFALFEERFFYEVPLGALYTAVAGGALFRLLKG